VFGLPAGGGAVQLSGTRPPRQLDTLPGDNLEQVARCRQQPMPQQIVQRPGTRVHGFDPLPTQLAGQREIDLGVAGTERAVPGGETGDGLAQPSRGLQQVTGDDGGLADALQSPRCTLFVAAGATTGEAVQAVLPATPGVTLQQANDAAAQDAVRYAGRVADRWNSRMASRKHDRLSAGLVTYSSRPRVSSALARACAAPADPGTDGRANAGSNRATRCSLE
jgi:hypothetical protein